MYTYVPRGRKLALIAHYEYVALARNTAVLQEAVLSLLSLILVLL